MGSRARQCTTCGKSHIPPTGKQCMMQTPLPQDEDEIDVESVEAKMELRKEQIFKKQQVLARTQELLELERQLAELNVRQGEIQLERETLAKSISELTQPQPSDLHDKKVKQQITDSVPGNPFQKEESRDQPLKHDAGVVGFSRPGECASSMGSDSESDSSTDSKSSRKHKHRSGAKKRRKLLRLNQYSSNHKKPKNFEECISASMGLALKLLEIGNDISGYLEHVWFISEQSSLSRFSPECILSYDEAVRDKAAVKGLSVFGYGDAENFYRHLGSGALIIKKDQKTKSIPMNRYIEGKQKSSEIKELRICGLYNHGTCHYGSACYRRHVCFACHQNHPRSDCPNVLTDNQVKGLGWVCINISLTILLMGLFCAVGLNRAGHYTPICLPNYVCCVKYPCSHTLGNVAIQLNPCMFFRECFQHPRGIDEKAHFIFDGILHGFKIVDDSSIIDSYCRSNYSSVTQGEFRDQMSTNIAIEQTNGKVSRVNSQPFCVHAIGGVRKKDGSLRPITDCKRPIGHSVNNYMNTTAVQFRFKTLDHVAELLTEGCYLAIVVISKAYRAVHIHSNHRRYHGFEWGGNWYTDNRLSFGLKCAPYVFTCLSDFVVRTMSRYGYGKCTNYIDDFLCYGVDEASCRDSQNFLVDLLKKLGFEVNVSKMVPPSQRVTYLGIEINTISREYSLPEHKLANLFPMIRSFQNKVSATRLELQSLAGYLNHCSYVVRGGRVFTRRVIDLIRSLPHDRAVGRINNLVKADLDWWDCFARTFNGRAGIIQESSERFFFCTDASQTGFGAVFGDNFFLGTWNIPGIDLFSWAHSPHWAPPPSYESMDSNINVLEFWPVLWSVVRWGHLWRGHKVVVYTDNNQVLVAINKNCSRNRIVMTWLREIFWSSFVHNFVLSAKRISSTDNIMADCLSRFSVSCTQPWMLLA